MVDATQPKIIGSKTIDYQQVVEGGRGFKMCSLIYGNKSRSS